MNPSKKPKSFQEIHRQRQQSSFVGREEQVALFRQNLDFGSEDERYHFLFNVWGQGGVGKTTLLGQFRSLSERANAITAYVDEGERDVPSVMGRLAEDLERQGYKLDKFSERYRVYRQKREELEADPDAPQGFSAFLGRTIAKSAMKLGKQIPVAGVALEFVDEESITTQGGEWSAFLAKKLTNKDEVHLLKEPLEVLTPLFLEDWGKVAEKKAVMFLFDTYEHTGEFLDEWLRDVLKGNYGTVPSNFLWVIAGREELDRNRWAEYEGVMARLPLEPFSEEEARQYLARKGVTNEQTITVILNLSGRLPLLIATLAETSPNSPMQVGDPSGTAVERFLKWETDAKRRQVALDAALPRCLNRDVIAQLRPDDGADDLFEWLKQKPFVRERTDGWAYHDVVRTQMLRYKLRSTPEGWADLHSKLADYYDRLRNDLYLEPEKAQRDATWQMHTLNLLYHRLCQSPQKHLSIALNEFLAALKNQRKFAEQWAEVMVQAGQDTDVATIQRWGEQLVKGLKAYNEERYEVTVKMFSILVEHSDIDLQWQLIARALRGDIYRLMKRYGEALQDFNQVIELNSKDARVIARRGQIYRLMERYKEALQDFNLATGLDPTSAWKIASRGVTYHAIKCYEEALQDFNLAIELNPKYTWAISRRGWTYRLMERYEKALQDFNLAIDLDPTSAWAIARRGEVYLLIRRYQDALTDFNYAVELDAENDWRLYDRAITYQALGQVEAAKTDLAQAICLSQAKYEKDSSNDQNTFNLALYYLANGEDEHAKQFYRHALRRSASVSRIQAALTDVKDFLIVFPNHPLAQQVHQVLQKALQK